MIAALAGMAGITLGGCAAGAILNYLVSGDWRPE